MDEDDSKVTIRSGSDDFTAVYDFNKHISTLSLISIGGILGLLQNDDVVIPDRAMMLSLAALGAASLVALLMNATIIGTPISNTRKPLKSKQVFYGQWLAVCLLIFGAGIFTGAFSTNL